jgi:ABC-type bacteriocin/lantibiotic exporter with double-glycine peptidase domain
MALQTCVRFPSLTMCTAVVGNLITVLLILGAMFLLSRRITLGAIVLLPIFVFPARFWGRKLQAMMRETYDPAGNMNNLMVERFNVAGTLLCLSCRSGWGMRLQPPLSTMRRSHP